MPVSVAAGAGAGGGIPVPAIAWSARELLRMPIWPPGYGDLNGKTAGD
jgi:hypothetical protein